ncbi:MAG TPA: hypothetical protein VGO61_00655 [Steroidobacteraceae bacterium]|jgi:hypothetical protein|nr:hypothetical protein [Steroidobacteraceae bacterium]
MGISETIIAAIIGALATMLTAIVQLVRNRAPSDGRPKPKKNRMRSVLATVALMIGCIVGGYAWSSLRAVSAKEELAATMEAEFTKQFAALAARQNPAAADGSAGAATDASGAAIPARNGEAGAAESLVHLPPCRISPQSDEVGPVSCTERVAQAVSLCASIPSAAHATNVRIQARVPKSESPWLERDGGAPTLGSLHIAAQPAEYPVSADKRSVCLDVANWSVDDTLAVRVIVEYAFGAAPTSELTAAAPTAHSL